MHEEFRNLISRASYHLASDRGMEYTKAYPLIDQAATIARNEGWDEDTIRELTAGQLVSVSEITSKL